MKRRSMWIVLLTLAVLAAGTGLAGAKDVIRVWTYPVYHGYDVELAGLVEQFEAENPDIDIEYEILSWLEGPQKFEVALNAGNPPDVFWGNPQPKYVQTGLVIDLYDFLSDEELAAYDKNLLDGFVIEGQLTGIPLYAGIWALGGNKALLEEAGIDWETIQVEGWTWDEFYSAVKKLTKTLPDGKKQWGFLMPTTRATRVDAEQPRPQVIKADGTLMGRSVCWKPCSLSVSSWTKASCPKKPPAWLRPQAGRCSATGILRFKDEEFLTTT